MTEEVTKMINELLNAGMSAQDISDALDNRISKRTVYRWAKGESEPQQPSDVVALRELCTKKQMETQVA